MWSEINLVLQFIKNIVPFHQLLENETDDEYVCVKQFIIDEKTSEWTVSPLRIYASCVNHESGR